MDSGAMPQLVGLRASDKPLSVPSDGIMSGVAAGVKCLSGGDCVLTNPQKAVERKAECCVEHPAVWASNVL